MTAPRPSFLNFFNSASAFGVPMLFADVQARERADAVHAVGETERAGSRATSDTKRSAPTSPMNSWYFCGSSWSAMMLPLLSMKRSLPP